MLAPSGCASIPIDANPPRIRRSASAGDMERLHSTVRTMPMRAAYDVRL